MMLAPYQMHTEFVATDIGWIQAPSNTPSSACSMQLTGLVGGFPSVVTFLALPGTERTTIRDVVLTQGLSHNHVMTIVHSFGRLGYAGPARGKSGGPAAQGPPRENSGPRRARPARERP